jgi:protoporphyrinogen oxidase
MYPREGSIQFPKAMAKEIEERGGKISLKTSLSGVELEKNKVKAVTIASEQGSRREEVQYVVSTIPITDLVRSMSPSPGDPVLASASQLRFRPILIACLWINKPQIFPYQTIYYTNRVFNRLAQMNSYSPTTTPAGTCGITAEMTCQVGDALWTMSEKDVIKKVVADMEAEGLIIASDVKEGMVLRNIHGYPVYHIGFEKHLIGLRQAIHEIPNLYVGGRQGMFNYAQMHYGVNSGMMIADHIVKGHAKPMPSTTDTEDVFFT